MEAICQECATPIVQQITGRPRLYCSNRCRQAAHRRSTATPVIVPAGRLEPLGSEPAALAEPAHPDEQVAVAILEARNLAGAFLRLGREARRQLAWRCESVGAALNEALHRYFEEIE